MARFTSVINGVSVSVSDETAERLGSEWEPADGAKRTSRAKSEADKK